MKYNNEQDIKIMIKPIVKLSEKYLKFDANIHGKLSLSGCSSLPRSREVYFDIKINYR